MSDTISLLPKTALSVKDYSTWRAENLVRIWNAVVTVGHEVRYYGNPSDKAGYVTRTRGPAYVRSSGVSLPVVEIEGIANAVPIDHLHVDFKR